MNERYCTVCGEKFTPRTQMSIHCAKCKVVENYIARVNVWQAACFADWVQGLVNAKVEEERMTA